MIVTLSATEALVQAKGDRQLARDLIRAFIVARAEDEARLAGCSLKCRVSMHALAGNGCANDGSTCICACHDPGAGPYTEENE